jgi:hypothetical protein
MFRSKSFRVLALLAGMAVVMYVVVSLFLPSSRRLVFGVDKRTGYVRRVQSHITFRRISSIASVSRIARATRSGMDSSGSCRKNTYR